MSGETIRGTESLAHVIGACWKRPRLLFFELLWRWSFGIPALTVVYLECMRLWNSLPPHIVNFADFSVTNPVAGAQQVASWVAAITPSMLHLLRWLLPLLMLLWAAVSGLGRSMVLRLLQPEAAFMPRTLILLQLLRIGALGATVLAWFFAIRWAAHSTLYRETPNLVGYFAWVICLSLGTLTLWAVFSWIFSIAPLLAVLESRGTISSLLASLHLGPMRGKLIEVNLVLTIVKLALLVLGMVFSATPLPFEAVMRGWALYLWWIAVSVLYLAASDFFQVVRLAVFVQFRRIYRGESMLAPAGKA